LPRRASNGTERAGKVPSVAHRRSDPGGHVVRCALLRGGSRGGSATAPSPSRRGHLTCAAPRILRRTAIFSRSSSRASRRPESVRERSHTLSHAAAPSREGGPGCAAARLAGGRA
jgi:hypothetical protein